MTEESKSIIDWIGKKALSSKGKEYLHSMPVLNREMATNEFKMILETATLLETGKNYFNFENDRISNIFINLEGNEPLEAKDYRTVGNFLAQIREIFNKISVLDWTENISSIFPPDYNISLEMTIKQSVNEKGEVSSQANPELAKIRKNLKATHTKISNTIKKMIFSSEYGQLLQEDYFTVRDDRYVLPFKTEFKRRMKGVVHNYSRSGQTAFLEPIDLLELNNDLSMLASKEMDEIIKVLKQLRGLLIRNFSYLKKCLKTTLHLESLFIRYRWMKEYSCAIPQFSKSGISLEKAWYPPVFIAAGEKTVKNDFLFNDNEKIMVISGPNAGGKTVSLKTVGTIADLSSKGFPVPAQKAVIPYFDKVFMVLGDKQSAVTGESSFSSHLKELAQTANFADENSLILIDEIGTGTDPLQGGAIARAYLEFSVEKNCYTIVTSHLAEVKSIALEDSRFIPVAMGFDQTKDKPTYKFHYNIVGGSNALSLVKNTGFPDSFTKRLEKLLLSKESSIEPLINRLRKKEEELNKKTEEINNIRKNVEKEQFEIRELNKRLALKEKKFEEERLVLLKRLLEMEEKELKKKIKKVDTKDAPAKIAVIRKEKESVKEAINRSKVDQDEKTGTPLSEISDRYIKGKTVVYDKLLKIEGLLQNIKNGKAEYICKGKTLKSPIERLLVLELKKKVKTSVKTASSESRLEERVDVRGVRTEESLDMVEKAIDTAFLNGSSSVAIMHGHGSGILKKMIRDFLPSIKNRYNFQFAPGSSEEGGDGVTVVKFSK
jgi:DNA mismatch repair protein MutS2